MNTKLHVLLLTSKSWAGFNISPPLGLYNLKTALEHCGHACDIFDYDIDDEAALNSRVAAGEYEVIGMSVTHVNMTADLDALQSLRTLAPTSKDTLIVAGGQEATMNYQQWLDSGTVDICFMGFADKSFSRFCNEIAGLDGMFHSENGLADGVLSVLKEIDGVACIDDRVDDGVLVNSPSFNFRPSSRLSQAEFDELFYVNGLEVEIPYRRYWEIVRQRKNNAFNNACFTVETVRLYTVSHCPRRCGFCSSQNFLPISQDAKSGIIMLSAERVFDLVMRYAREMGARAFLFSDDDFPVGHTAGIERLKAFCHMVIEAKRDERMASDVQFFCQARVLDFMGGSRKAPKSVKRDLLSLMKTAGFHNIGLGIETFSERLMHVPSVNKVGATLEDYKAVIDALLEVGIVPQMFIIVGIPESTVEEVIDSMLTAVEYITRGADVAVISTMRAYPGSPMALSEKYALVTRPWVNRETGKRIDILDYFIPSDDRIANIVNKIDAAAEQEQEHFRRRFSWPADTIMSKSLIGVTHFIAVAKLLARRDVADRMYDLVEKSVLVSPAIRQDKVEA